MSRDTLRINPEMIPIAAGCDIDRTDLYFHSLAQSTVRTTEEMRWRTIS